MGLGKRRQCIIVRSSAIDPASTLNYKRSKSDSSSGLFHLLLHHLHLMNNANRLYYYRRSFLCRCYHSADGKKIIQEKSRKKIQRIRMKKVVFHLRSGRRSRRFSGKTHARTSQTERFSALSCEDENFYLRREGDLFVLSSLRFGTSMCTWLGLVRVHRMRIEFLVHGFQNKNMCKCFLTECTLRRCLYANMSSKYGDSLNRIWFCDAIWISSI